LKKKFRTTAELNRLWGLVYWGQLLSDWNEVPSRDNILNPGYKLEWERYQQKIVTDFLAWQASIVNQYKRPNQFVTQDFVGGTPTNIDEFEIAKHLDITAVNPYHGVQDDLGGEWISLSGDVCRSLKHNNYLVTETNCSDRRLGVCDSRAQVPLSCHSCDHEAAAANEENPALMHVGPHAYLFRTSPLSKIETRSQFRENLLVLVNYNYQDTSVSSFHGGYPPRGLQPTFPNGSIKHEKVRQHSIQFSVVRFSFSWRMSGGAPQRRIVLCGLPY
jgi:hypothetical protein